MKNILTAIVLFTLPFAQSMAKDLLHVERRVRASPDSLPAANLIIITIDGFRWQEVFAGADTTLINDTSATADTGTMKMLYWAASEKERRQKLMPFFWNVIAQKGQLYGNRHFNNRVNTANIYSFSYPGYNEIFTGNTDLLVSSNKKKHNRNVNVLEYLHSKPAFKGKVVAFTSWDVFPFILNEEKSGMLVNSGNETMAGPLSDEQALIGKVQEKTSAHAGGRHDQLTFLTAGEYMEQNRPRVVLLGLGETDEYAHNGRYDRYLEQANQTDRMLGELWHWIQSTPGYKDNTALLITTDHGRGSRDKTWSSHSSFIRGSSQTWMALMGPSIIARGEIQDDQQLYQQQIAGLIAGLLGEKFEPVYAGR